MIDIFLEDLEEKDSVRYQQLLTALNQKEEYSAPTIVRVVNGWGFDISTTAIKDWRRKNA